LDARRPAAAMDAAVEATPHAEGATLLLCDSSPRRFREQQDSSDFWGPPRQQCSLEEARASPSEDQFRLYMGEDLARAGLLPATPALERRPSVLNLIDFDVCNPPLPGKRSEQGHRKATAEVVVRAARTAAAPAEEAGSLLVRREAFVGALEAHARGALCREAVVLWRHAARESRWQDASERLQQENAKLRLKINKAVSLLSQR